MVSLVSFALALTLLSTSSARGGSSSIDVRALELDEKRTFKRPFEEGPQTFDRYVRSDSGRNNEVSMCLVVVSVYPRSHCKYTLNT